MTRLRGALPFLQVAASLALLALLWRAVDGPAAARILARADFGWLGLALAAVTLQLWLSALRWKVTAGRLGQDFGIGAAIREYYLSQLVNQTLPGGMLGDANRAVRARHRAGLVRAGQAVVFERVAGQAALFAVMGGALVATALDPGGPVWPSWLVSFVALVCAGALGVALAAHLGARLPGRAGRSLDDLRGAFRTALLAPRVLPVQVALSLATTLCNVAAFSLCAKAIGTVLPVGEALVLVPAILAAMLIPLSVSGWGLREGAAAALLPLAGASPEAAIAASVAFGLVFAASALPGAVALLQTAGAARPRP